MSDTHAEFDIERAAEMAKDYINATGMECLIMKSDGKGLLKPCATQGHEVLCYQKDGTIGKGCIETHLYGMAKSKSSNQIFTYFCPVGLLHWAVPIIVNSEVQGAFIGGHAFLNRSRSTLAQLKTYSKSHGELIEKVPELRKSLASSPVIDTERLESLKNILALMAESLSDSEPDAEGIKERWEALLAKERSLSSLEKEQAKKWQLILTKMKSGTILEKEEGLQALLSDIEESDEDLDSKKNRLAMLLIGLTGADSEGNDEFYLAEMALKAIESLDVIEDRALLRRWSEKNLRRIMESGAYLPSIKYADTVYKALLYIEDNYMKHISLQEIADHVHFSAPYFSKVFKKELNMTFTQYLTKIRVDEAKKLLADKSIPLAEIPNMVGFEEQSYFSKVFRLATGTSPGRYRESL